MTEETIYRHQIKVSARQTEFAHDSYAGDSVLSEDYQNRMRDAQARLLQLEQEKAEMERLAKELEELDAKKRLFFSGQVEVTEKLSNAVTLMDRELLAMRTELQELEQCRHAFDNRLKKIAKFDPESWTQENVKLNLEKAIQLMDQANDEYEQAAQHFSSMRSGEIFGTGRRRKALLHADGGDFIVNLKNGLAFNLPIILVAIAAMVVYSLC
jgi:chromosome segregation ATPase